MQLAGWVFDQLEKFNMTNIIYDLVSELHADNDATNATGGADITEAICATTNEIEEDDRLDSPDDDNDKANENDKSEDDDDFVETEEDREEDDEIFTSAQKPRSSAPPSSVPVTPKPPKRGKKDPKSTSKKAKVKQFEDELSKAKENLDCSLERLMEMQRKAEDRMAVREDKREDRLRAEREARENVLDQRYALECERRAEEKRSADIMQGCMLAMLGKLSGINTEAMNPPKKICIPSRVYFIVVRDLMPAHRKVAPFRFVLP